MSRIANIFWLSAKEFRSLGHDFVLLAFVLYSFTFAIYSQATGMSHELRNASIAIVDEDDSRLSRAIAQAFLRNNFKPPVLIALAEVDRRMDTGRNTFVVDIPPRFAADVRAGRQPAIQVNIDATAMMQAGIGAGYLEEIISDEINKYVTGSDVAPAAPVSLRMRFAFNPTLESSWFLGVMALLNNITMLAILLAGAAVMREREHGTMAHLLVMPLTPFEIAMAKVLANGAVITVLTGFALRAILERGLGMPILGSVPLFIGGVMLYLFFTTAVGLFLGTVTRSMPQLGLVFILIVMPMDMLSGSHTPLESMPQALQTVMLAVPSTQFVKIAQAILYRGAGIDIVWPNFLAVAGVGAMFFVAALLRFRAAMSQS